jgi:hypothetical protein
VQDYLPYTATLDRELSLHILNTNRGNLICIHHQRHRGQNYETDGFANGKYVLVGVPYPSVVTSSNDDEKPPPAAGHMHCGCNIDVALLDFFWWKTWVLKSTRPGFAYSEGMKDQSTEPRVRAFFAGGFMEAMGMTVDDLYRSQAGSKGYNSRDVCLFQLMHMLQLVNEFNAQDGSPLLSIGFANNHGE